MALELDYQKDTYFPDNILEVGLAESFTRTITVKESSIESGFELVSINVTKNFDESGVTTSGGTISGTFIEIFDPITPITIEYVELGQSDKTSVPKTVLGLSKVPAMKSITSFKQPAVDRTQVTYTVVVTLLETLTELETQETFQLSQNVVNNFDVGRNFLRDYFDYVPNRY